MFVLLLFTSGVVVGVMLWAFEHTVNETDTIPEGTNSTIDITDLITNLTTTTMASHNLRKRRIEVINQTCPTDRVGSTTLCVPVNVTTTVTIPWGTLENNVHKIGVNNLWQSKYHWYLTKGNSPRDDWIWRNLVAETGPNWSSYSKGDLVLLWRNRLTLTKSKVELKMVIKPGNKEGCQEFILAPWINHRGAPLYIYYFKWFLNVCVMSAPAPSSVTKKEGQGAQSGSGMWGPVRMTAYPPTFDDAIYTATGVSGFSNNWLLLTEEAGRVSRQDCVVCMGARPLLRIVPATLPVKCVFPVMRNSNPTRNCSSWDKVYPLVKGRQAPIFSSDVAEGNFTCVNMTQGPPYLGTVPPHWCNATHFPNAPLKVVARADVWWWCGGNGLLSRFPPNSSGLCALVSLLLPIAVHPMSVAGLLSRVSEIPFSRYKRHTMVSPTDNPTYIDAIGVPRGVPDKYKLVNQVTAGFESSVCWWCTVNKNVDRINYIHFNVQRLGNWTQQGFEAVHGQLSATSLMAFQNRIAIDMLLAEKGGVCSMFGQQCCTFIPNNTASDGSLTVALEGLRTLNGKMKSHSGIDNSMWDSWLDAFGKYKTLVSSVLISISVFAAILVLCGCCCIPCIRSLTNKVITKAIDPSAPAQMYPLLGPEDVYDDLEMCEIN
jgi:hypothetical protein